MRSSYWKEKNMAEASFYRCNRCGNVVALLHEGEDTSNRCGTDDSMELLVPNTTDAANEKHVPGVSREDDKLVVTIGSVEHPMTEAHLIEFVALVKANGDINIKRLKATDKPRVTFCAHDVEGATVYAYCNLHGLWAADVK